LRIFEPEDYVHTDRRCNVSVVAEQLDDGITQMHTPGHVTICVIRAEIERLMIAALDSLARKPLLMNIAHDLQTIVHQEQTLVFPQFDSGRAWQTGVQLREMAVARGAPMVIDVRTFGQPLFFAALDGATPDNVRWAQRKARTVEHFRRSSYAIGLSLQQASATLADKYSLPAAEFASHGGAFPLTVKGAGVIGVVTVSGLPQRQDHEFVVEALCAVLGHDASTLAFASDKA
jgi:uncharacterized protein (UPF0303 family)